MDSKKPNKIREIVRLQQILKKWRKLANTSSSSSSTGNNSNNKKSIQSILKRTLSLSERSSSSSSSSASASEASQGSGEASSTVVPRGYVAVCVGEEQKRFVVPTEYLGRRAFRALLREAEEEFGFEQTGVLRIPCEVSVFQRVLTSMEANYEARGKRSSSSSARALLLLHDQSWYDSHDDYDRDDDEAMLGYYFCSSETGQLGFPHRSDHHSPMCR